MMNQALDSNLFDFVDSPTVEYPAIAKPTLEQGAPQLPPQKLEGEASLQLSIREPSYPVFALVPCLVFLAVFIPLFLSVVMNANGIIYVFVMLVGKLVAAH
jgi:hypothetical protein